MTIRDKVELAHVLDVRRRWVAECPYPDDCSVCPGLLAFTPQQFLNNWLEARDVLRELRRRAGQEVEDETS